VSSADADRNADPVTASRLRIGGALLNDRVSRNGFALLVNTGVSGVLGFAYWLIAAHLFSTSAVGRAGALVSATTLFAVLGQLNLSGALMRFLPTAGPRSRRLVVLTYATSAGVSALIAAASIGIVNVFAPHGSLALGMGPAAVVVVAAAATALFNIQDSALIGLRKAMWVPLENGGFGIAKIGLLFVVAPIGSAFALFAAWMIPLALTIPLITLLLFRVFLPPAADLELPQLSVERRRSFIRFVVGDATGGLFNQAWIYLLPVIVTATLGSDTNALYYVSFLFSSTVDQVGVNFASVLTVEGAHSLEDTAALVRTAIRRVFSLVVPLVVCLMVLAPWLLRAFGTQYEAAIEVFRILLIMCVPRALVTIYFGLNRILQRTHRSAYLQVTISVLSIAAGAFLAHPYGLRGIALALLGIQVSASLVAIWGLRAVRV